jgi:single-stranded-DNA-specific exonuclease
MPAENLPEMERRLHSFAAQKLAGKDAEQILRIHAELPLDRVTPALAGWLRKLEPLGHGNAEPVFVARSLRLTAPVRLMKEKHIRLELTPALTSLPAKSAPIKAIGWSLARRAHDLKLEQGSVIDLAYRIRENDHPQYGGLQIEIAGIELASEVTATGQSL